MPHASTSTAASKLRAALDLFDAGVSLMRQNLRRAFPDAGEGEIDARLRQWLHQRPGAEFGDCPGRAIDPADRFR